MKTWGAIAAAAMTLAATLASSATVGVAVYGDESKVEVAGQPTGNTDAADNTTFAQLAALAGTGPGAVIGFYNPISGADCTFGDALCGLQSDRGLGGPKMTMWIWFDEKQAGNGTLSLTFEDQDFLGFGNNDPYYFREALHVLGTTVEDISVAYPGVTVSGDGDTQQAVDIDLGFLNASPDGHWISLGFSSQVNDGQLWDGRAYHYYDNCAHSLSQHGDSWCPRNTPEYMIATLHVAPIPLPAAAWLLLGGLGGLVSLRRFGKSV